MTDEEFQIRRKGFNDCLDELEVMDLDVEKMAKCMYRRHNRNRLGGDWDNELDRIKQGYLDNAQSIIL